MQPSSADEDSRRHRRIHSRNLSVHFPRPSPARAPSTIVEAADDDDESEVQEVEIKPKPFGAGFKFGARPPSSADSQQGFPSPPLLSGKSESSTTSRRGHHHKHSLSHNLFSFLDPDGQQQQQRLHTQPTPTPVSPWTPMSGITPQTSTFAAKQEQSLPPPPPPRRAGPPAVAAAVQAVLGALMWVRGQNAPSLATTALGYWIVFDAFGLAICTGLALRMMGLASSPTSVKESVRRPFGNMRVESVLLFSQVVYLMFAAVYVCKETVEHLLLSAGGGVQEGDGHHHHRGDEALESGNAIDFPYILMSMTLCTLLWTGIGFDNHSKLVSITNTRIPLSFAKLLAAVVPAPNRPTYLHSSSLGQPLSEQWILALSNPYTALPFLITVALLITAVALPPSIQHTADLFLAAGITFLTFDLAYRACTVIGTVLLQTSPPRAKHASAPSLADGKMEKFLRVMREVERHHQVLHLPAPHIWQLAPPAIDSSTSIGTQPASELVVTLELHVRPDLPDEDALNLTRWVWERCISALGVPGALSLAREGEGEAIGAQVTVGIVRG